MSMISFGYVYIAFADFLLPFSKCSSHKAFDDLRIALELARCSPEKRKAWCKGRLENSACMGISPAYLQPAQ